MTEPLNLAKLVEQILQSAYAPNGPGAAVIVTQHGETLLRKAIGMANLELNVPIEPDMIFRIGSLTKQFTAVAILMLVEQGKLQLDDTICTFLPDYPTQGQTITIEHLLTHTSGIQDYTEMPEIGKQMGKDFTPLELVDTFKFQPLQFAPGTQWRYDNSGYFLLGVIIEKVSGLPYAEFLQRHLFDPLALKHTCYDQPIQLIPRRVSGYHKTGPGYINAPYISMSQPYAGGGLLSTIDDLARWDAALVNNPPVSQKMLEKAWTRCRLADGQTVDYGYGWYITSLMGIPIIEHGGTIYGFQSHVVRVPEAGVFVAVLSNLIGGSRFPEEMALRIAGFAAGRPIHDPVPVTLNEDQKARLLANYRNGAGLTWAFTFNEGRYFLRWPGTFKLEFVPVSSNEFIAVDNIFLKLCFSLGSNGQSETMALQTRAGAPDVGLRIS